MMLSHQDLKVVAAFLGVMGVGSGVVWLKSGGPFVSSSSTPRVIGVHPQAFGPTVPQIITRINVNSATAEELERLPGIGPMLARRIVRDRSDRGPFGKIEDLRRVKGIGPKLFAKIASHLVVENPQSKTTEGSPRGAPKAPRSLESKEVGRPRDLGRSGAPNRQSKMDHP